jgi:DNA uptake protein ComE-like DNA-binding protein
MLKRLVFIGLSFVVMWPMGLAQPIPQETDRPAGHKSEVPEQERIDINHATVPELMKVPGMTKPWAERIVRFRPYRSKQDLLRNGVLPGDVYARLADYLIAHHDKK